MKTPALVNARWLNEKLREEANLVVLHTSMMNPVTGQKPAIGHEVIPNAKHFDFERVFCDLNSVLPHTMPTAEVFTENARTLGINNDSVIVVYDDMGIYCAPRVWWMFKSMGHHAVYVLDGGLPAWKKQGFACDNGFSKKKEQGNFQTQEDKSLILAIEKFQERRKEQGLRVLDARSKGRFQGTEPEPRAGLRGGHIPDSKSLPFDAVLTNGYMKPVSELEELFHKRGCYVEHSVVFSCGSGVTACILALAAFVVGFDDIAVYDGSWSEWGSDLSLPVELGS